LEHHEYIRSTCSLNNQLLGEWSQGGTVIWEQG